MAAPLRFYSIETTRNEITTIKAINTSGRLVEIPLPHREVARLTSHLAGALERSTRTTPARSARGRRGVHGPPSAALLAAYRGRGA